ncbi:MAG: dTMP kinase [Synechococcales bacterium]|nr:dTMP kinase [Synechococcales bacterium]
MQVNSKMVPQPLIQKLSTDPSPQSNLWRGKFIVFEGGEGCGKTTQLQRTEQWLVQAGWLQQLQAQGSIANLVVTREPGGTALCQKIRQILLEPTDEPVHDRCELLLYAADRAQHVTGCLRPHLEQGNLILCDRYTGSTIAYQGYGRGLDLDLIAQLNQIATQGLNPDLTIWLDLEAEIGLQRAQTRGKRDRIEQADLEFHQRVRQGFAALQAQQGEQMVRLDASRSIEVIGQEIATLLEQKFKQWFLEM